MTPGTRERMMDAAIDSLRRKGVAGMSFTEVLEASGAARGAIYHHFPAGKSQLVAEAAALHGRQVEARLRSLPAASPAEVVEAFIDAIRPVVAQSSAGSGCAVAAVTIGTPDDLRRTAADAFAAWQGALSERLSAAGLPDPESCDLACALITMLEGAHVLCRASGDLEPFERVARTMAGFASALRSENEGAQASG
jgi:AcrR family transcriptional regulator